MLKWLAILGGTTLLVAAILVAVYYQQRDHKSEGYDIKCTQGGVPTAATSGSLACEIYQSQNTKQGHSSAHWWDVLIAWPEGITAWLLLLTLGAIVWQSWGTWKAANAALLNAQAVINAERPWLIVVIKSPAGPHSIFTVHARNKGKNPALIVETRIGCARVESLSHLPAEAPYGGVGMLKNHVVVPGGAARVHLFDHSIFKHAWKDESREFPNEGDLFVFGKILYRDLANPDPSVIHETRWISIYEPPVEEVPIGGYEGNRLVSIEGIGIPEEYDKHT